MKNTKTWRQGKGAMKTTAANPKPRLIIGSNQKGNIKKLYNKEIKECWMIFALL